MQVGAEDLPVQASLQHFLVSTLFMPQVNMLRGSWSKQHINTLVLLLASSPAWSIPAKDTFAFFFLLFFPANFAHFSRSSSLLLCPRLSLYCRVLLSWRFGYLYLSTPCQERNKLLHALLGKLLHALLGTLLAAAVASASLTLRGLWNRHQKSLHVF